MALETSVRGGYQRALVRQNLPWLEDVVRAKRPKQLPIVLTRDEVRAVITELHGAPLLMATLCSMAPGWARSNAPGRASGRSISRRIRSSSATARARR